MNDDAANDEIEDLSLSRTFPAVDASKLTKEILEAAKNARPQLQDRTGPKAHAKATKKAKTAVGGGTGSGGFATSSDRFLQADQIVDDKYRILSLLGEGGMGAVYQAHHMRLNKAVALKTFNAPNLSEDTWRRFQREAQAIGRLQHKNIVQVFDFGIADGTLPYYTMEVLSGESAQERIERKGALNLDEALWIFSELCQGLWTAHQKGIVHRDIKPANLFLELHSATDDRIERVKLVDFGIAGLADESSETQKLTSAGMIFGSPYYMSPEQSMGAKVDARGDIYSCGCTLFEMLTGVPPFRGANAFATMLAHQVNEPPTLEEASGGREFPEWLEVLVASTLAKNPDERVQNLQEVLDVMSYHIAAGKRRLGGTTTTTTTTTTAARSSRSDAPVVVASQAVGKVDESLRTESEGGGKNILIALGVLACLGAIAGAMIFFWQPKAPMPGVTASIKGPANATADGPINVSALPDTVPTDGLNFAVHGSKVADDALRNQPFEQPKPSARRRRFIFPSSQNGVILGYLQWGSRSDRVKADGEVIVPANNKLIFHAGEGIYRSPELMLRFRPDDLHAVIFDTGIEGAWSDKHIGYLKHLTGLKKLELKECQLTARSIDVLNNFPLLVDLNIGYSGLSGADLIKLKSLPKLTMLVCTGVTNLGPVVEVIGRGNKLTYITANGCGLTDRDVSVICRDKRLEYLDMNDNRLTNACLQYIVALPRLTAIRLDASDVNADGLPWLLKIANPDIVVEMPPAFWTPANIHAMRTKFKIANLNSTPHER